MLGLCGTGWLSERFSVAFVRFETIIVFFFMTALAMEVRIIKEE